MNTSIKNKLDRPKIKQISAVEWSDELSLNNENIDAQHKNLFALTNELIKHSDADAHSEIINETLYELLQYIDIHFAEEEELLEKVNYPKLEEHKKIHRSFTRKIAMFCRDVVKGKAHIAEELLVFLTEWIRQHTSIDDQDYKNYIQ